MSTIVVNEFSDYLFNKLNNLPEDSEFKRTYGKDFKNYGLKFAQYAGIKKDFSQWLHS